MTEKKRKVLFDENQIKETVKKLGDQISKHYKDQSIIVVPLLRGSFIFAADLVREISSPVIIDFMTTSSYEDKECSSGKVEVLQKLRCDIEGKNVLVVDDICDSGNTAKNIMDLLSKENPKSIKLAVMLDKPSRRQVDIKPDFVGQTIDDVFIVGYGLNYGDYYRNVPYIFTFED
ncbi:MAG: hypoxanthine phosphoribosyltransferase [Tissierellia bacterium]|nr:hypoxanthine phosphoribosyltransferase [Tissierellia bacterium]